MRILIDLIDNPRESGYKSDHRFKLLKGIGNELINRGHKVWGTPINRKVKEKIPKNFKAYNKQKSFSFDTKKRLSKFDLYIAHSPMAKSLSGCRRKKIKNMGKYILAYDHGWLNKSLIVDRNNLFSDSAFYHKIYELIQENYDEEKAEEYRQYLLSNNITKRPQKKQEEIPCSNYIFVPGQTLYDASIVNHSKTGLLTLLQKVIEFGIKYNYNVIFKPHPNILPENKSHGKKEINEFCNKSKNKYKNFHVVKAPIYDLMQNAEFTATVSSGSIIDNIVTHTPVYCCGDTYFSKSGCVIYDPNVEEGLKMMANEEYDWNFMVDCQKKMLWWLNNHLPQEGLGAKENVNRLEYFLGIKL